MPEREELDTAARVNRLLGRMALSQELAERLTYLVGQVERSTIDAQDIADPGLREEAYRLNGLQLLGALREMHAWSQDVGREITDEVRLIGEERTREV